ncbi:MAG: DUF6259 domain-containing protein [Thermaerobacter sp.]|nr:DUF6259 domain-containing protein [Thermaerobacter sp.]
MITARNRKIRRGSPTVAAVLLLSFAPAAFPAAAAPGAPTARPAVGGGPPSPGNGLVLGNHQVQLVLDRHSGGIHSFVNRLTGTDYLATQAAPPDLFRLTFVNRNGKRRLIRARNLSFGYRLLPLPSGREVSMRFSGSSGFPVTVRASVSLGSSSPLTYWRIAVRPPPGYALVSITYPILEGIGPQGKGGYAVMPIQDGAVLRHPYREIMAHGDFSSEYYPAQGTPLQLALLGDARGGLYLAAYDPGGNAKSFDLIRRRGSLELFVNSRLPRAYGASVIPGYPMVLGVYRGGWTAGADLYRRWARSQPWTTPGPFPSRAHLPAWVNKGPVMVSVYTDYGPTHRYSDARLVESIRSFKGRAEPPVMVRWMGWEHAAPWAGPDVFPPFEGWATFRQTVGELHRLGVKVMVGLSAGTWTTTLPDYRSEGAGCALRTADGAVEVAYPQHAAVWSTCPAFEQREVQDVTQLAKVGVDVIQLDALFHPPYDYASNHGHLPGFAGAAYSRSMAAFLVRLESAARAVNPHILFATEGLPELFLPYASFYISDGVSFQEAAATPRFKGSVQPLPLYEYVYHRYAIPLARQPFGPHAPLPDIRSFNAYRDALSLQLGIEPSVASYEDRKAPWPAEAYATSAPGIYTRYAARLADGAMLSPPLIASRVVTLEVPFVTKTGRPFNYSLTTPAVLASAWNSAAGMTVVLSNITGKTQLVYLAPPATGFSNPRYTLVGATGTRTPLAASSSIPVSVPPRRTVLIEVARGAPIRPRSTQEIVLVGAVIILAALLAVLAGTGRLRRRRGAAR